MMKVDFKNPKTGELKSVKVGWSWTLFLFSGFLGFPLFLRGLNVWGGVFLALWIVNLLFAAIGDSDQASGAAILFTFIFLGLAIWAAIKGNELTAKNYLEKGWNFTDPDSAQTNFAKGKWGIAV
jgi:hypothetical protein